MHEKSGSSVGIGNPVMPQNKVVIKEEEKETGGDAVIVNRVHDSDLLDGGIALSPSDLDRGSWSSSRRDSRMQAGSGTQRDSETQIEHQVQRYDTTKKRTNRMYD